MSKIDWAAGQGMPLVGPIPEDPVSAVCAQGFSRDTSCRPALVVEVFDSEAEATAFAGALAMETLDASFGL